LSAWPSAQSAAVGLAADLFRVGDTAAAADVVRSTTENRAASPDPWWSFDAADARFVPVWLEELRKVAW